MIEAVVAQGGRSPERISRPFPAMVEAAATAPPRARQWLAAGAGVAALLGSGCAAVPPASGAQAAEAQNAATTASRAERVFLYQSRVADALLERYPLLEIYREADPDLIEAEQHMTEICSPLTRAVLARLEGDEPSLRLRFKVFTSLDDCERAARRIDRLLEATGTDGDSTPI